MRFFFFVAFSLAVVLSFLMTVGIARLAKKNKIVDVPDTDRRFHKTPTPTLGGVAIFVSFFIITFGLGILGKFLIHGNIPLSAMIGIWVGGLILMIGGYLDDRYRLNASRSVVFPVLATLVIVSVGVKAVSIHNPLNTQVVFLMPWVSGLVVFLWTMTMTYTTKLLDGMDGLVGGISGIAAVVLFFVSLSPQVSQPQTAFLAIVFAGCMFGFLILNFHPAKIFLGEGGSTFAGFMLATLAVVSGGKIATALLVMGIPLLDMVWVILQRIINHQSPFSGDRKHLHFKLIEIGFSEPQAVLFLYALTAIFGISALFLQSRGKLIAFVILILVMLAIIASIFSVYNNKKQNHEK